ncbi:NADP-specific glutamate dehydrogenase [Blautia hydrogenotrophica]|uniref:Glutamate dehydrogenase n=1 Tax=Blautia hydrogenotrophica (strain DSM 10507 / JCM 14656 / S5a33) TaxID=476272 RepID=C0CS54_BLAHS|nr:NADP-specific glutamate dehydrogenase [Blautia hydrogenotrophica]SCH57133.1 NAD-specific glutamate dehydrogenase [uncultured Blautia sp.]EEG47401.1 Glu/Leu/Phe/Val dehydrogenase, dimerization domain protein [Blautia hydrogenotrophica DSM 10507]MCT6798343.1 NADP-specific glutamate dehydrogenase [Blautia hydrogenotrophica]MEE0461720.1 NADP-specific glutamate dehydrogenase [Blautia hydrogenotrophica]WPX85397.1 NAD-specific glutamate dehydrogenase [Blautia hydrogenotrophica DSM 10507]
MNAYMQRVLDTVKQRDGNEPEFIQTVEEVFKSLEVVIEKHPEYEKAALLERMVEPDRMFSFRVTWTDDNGVPHVNRGYRCQFNGAIGPYKGGLRFHPSVYSGIIKFLGFEQTFKNSLTGLPIGGGKGGSDFDPRGKSDAEIMRFCQAFMTELYKYIGPDVDVPAGDIGVGGREIGYLFGQYKRIRSAFENGVLTGKGLSYGGSLIRPEATGFGAVYYVVEVLKHFGEDIKGKTIAVSGFGNVSWGVCKKVAELGGKVVTLSGPDGYIYDPDGVTTPEKINYLVEMRNSGRDKVQDYADKFGCEFHAGEKPWGVKVDLIMPCATQNDVNMEWAEKIVANGVPYYIEVANMPTTNDALEYLQKNCKVVAPSKAVNAGGVATSALEMSQNSMRYSWTEEEVDAKLKQIMKNIHDMSASAAEEYGLGYDLVAGANIAGFKKVADAMMSEGLI